MSNFNSPSYENLVPSVTYYFKEDPYCVVTLVNVSPGKGFIQVASDWGDYTAYWGAMGSRSVGQFVTQMNSAYIEGSFRERLYYMPPKQSALIRLTKFMAHCWPTVVERIKRDLQ